MPRAYPRRYSFSAYQCPHNVVHETLDSRPAGFASPGWLSTRIRLASQARGWRSLSGMQTLWRGVSLRLALDAPQPAHPAAGFVLSCSRRCLTSAKGAPWNKPHSLRSMLLSVLSPGTPRSVPVGRVPPSPLRTLVVLCRINDLAASWPRLTVANRRSKGLTRQKPSK